MANAYNSSSDIRKMAHTLSEFNISEQKCLRVVNVSLISLRIHGIESGPMPDWVIFKCNSIRGGPIPERVDFADRPISSAGKFRSWAIFRSGSVLELN